MSPMCFDTKHYGHNVRSLCLTMEESLADDSPAALLDWSEQSVEQQKNLCNILDTDTLCQGSC